MKKHYTIVALIVLVGSMAMAAQAQTGARNELRASIPFQFHLGSRIMPAGEYTITKINTSSGRAVLQLRNRTGKRTAMVQVDDVIGAGPETARLVFNRLGGEYCFTQAWTGVDSNGWQAPKSRIERASRQELARTKPAVESVALGR